MKPPKRSSSQRGYDRLAACYHAIEWSVFGNRLQQARVALLDQLPPWRRMLILGEGDGRLLDEICMRIESENRIATHSLAEYKIHSVDQSLNMLRRQQTRLKKLAVINCVEFLQRDARCYLPPADSYDVLITPFFLDCFSLCELENCLPRWLAGLRQGGTLYHVDFVLPASGWHRPAGRLLIAVMHWFFRWQTGLRNRELIDLQPHFANHGLRKAAERTGMGGMITTQLWTKLSAIPQT